MVIEGRFDYTLLQPFNSLLRSLAGGADLLDLVLLIPISLMMIVIGWKIPGITLLNVLLYFLLLINSMIIVTSFHIVVLSVGILTTTVDHAIMIYRDIVSMGRLPVDIYREPLKTLITFIIPVGIIMTFPSKVIMGFLSFPFILFSLFVGIVFLIGSIRLWNYSLTKYSSASS
jgi:ABC-2 type transport system permease protein